MTDVPHTLVSVCPGNDDAYRMTSYCSSGYFFVGQLKTAVTDDDEDYDDDADDDDGD